MTSGVFSGCKLSLLKHHIFLIFTQVAIPGWLLAAVQTKNSIRGTDPILMFFKQKNIEQLVDSLKVHKIENFLDSDFGICVISFLVMHK